MRPQLLCARPVLATVALSLAGCGGSAGSAPTVSSFSVVADGSTDRTAPAAPARTRAVDAGGLTDPQTSDGGTDAPSTSTEASADAGVCTNPVDIVIRDARSHLGQPYVWGADGPCTVGYDCSGLVWAVFKETGYFSIIGGGGARDVPQIAAVFSKAGLEDTDTTKLPEPGDLITFGDYAHIGIYVGVTDQGGVSNAKGWVVNALNETTGVVETRVDTIIPGVHSYLHTRLSSLPCAPGAFTPAACP